MARKTTHEGDLVAVLTDDHRAVDSAFEKYESGALSDEQRRDLVDHIITELVRHSVAEEQYLYPAARTCRVVMSWPTTRSRSTPRPRSS
jgi:hemerythrin superfamily protein